MVIEGLIKEEMVIISLDEKIMPVNKVIALLYIFHARGPKSQKYLSTHVTRVGNMDAKGYR